jgi:hypothetical protein
MDAFFQGLGMALIAAALCWFTLPRAGLSRPTGRLLFAKLVGVFLALHLVGLAAMPGGVNPLVTTLATYAVGRWVLLRPRST